MSYIKCSRNPGIFSKQILSLWLQHFVLFKEHLHITKTCAQFLCLPLLLLFFLPDFVQQTLAILAYKTCCLCITFPNSRTSFVHPVFTFCALNRVSSHFFSTYRTWALASQCLDGFSTHMESHGLVCIYFSDLSPLMLPSIENIKVPVSIIS